MSTRSPADVVAVAVRRALAGAGVGAGARLVVGCSGGPDSTALLLSLARLRGPLDLTLRAVFVDHGLRAEAAGEGRRVLALCAGLQVPGEAARVTVSAGASLQAAAREARYRVLREVARREGAQAVAVGHTAADQAETLLLRLLGGAGPRGLGAMAPVRPLDEGVLLVRPLLRVDRGAVLAFLAEAGVEPVRDPSNEDRRFLRSRIRHEVLPLLRREHPDLDRHLGELCATLRADADCLDELAAAALLRLRQEGGAVPVAGLRTLPAALQARTLQRLLGPLSRRQLAAVLGICESEAGTQSVALGQGRRAERRYGKLRLVGEDHHDHEHAHEQDIPGPGEHGLPWGTLRIEAGPFPLRLRTPRPGDRIRLGAGHRKVSDVLVDRKVPRPLRRQARLLCRGDEVLCVVAPGPLAVVSVGVSVSVSVSEPPEGTPL